MNTAALRYIPNEMTERVLNFLDPRSMASCSKVSKKIRKLMEEMKLPLSTLELTSYLTDELFTAGMYKKARESKKGEEWETFKSEVGCTWFNALSGKSVISSPLLKFAISYLSQHSWSDFRIESLCHLLHHEARQEMPGVAASWIVTEIPTKKEKAHHSALHRIDACYKCRF